MKCKRQFRNLRPLIDRKKAIRGKCFCDALIDSLDFELRDRSHAKQLVNKIPHILHLLSKNPYEPVDKNAHPIARKLLVETFFWSSGDPLSPHGSDIGAMIFFDYEKDTPEFGNGTFGFYCSAVAGIGGDSDPVIVFQVLAAVVFAELKKYGKIGSRFDQRIRA